MLGNKCEDDDECVSGYNNCDAADGQVCINVPGSFKCACTPGLVLEKGKCISEFSDIKIMMNTHYSLFY